MTTVYWSPIFNNMSGMELLCFAPEPVLPYIAKNRNSAHPAHFTKCPAFQDYYKNTYVIKSPVDITIKYNSDTRFLTIEPQNQDFFEGSIKHRGAQIGEDDPFLMSFGVHYLFVATESCLIELLPVTHHSTVVASKVRLVQGTFDISKWFRPVEFAFELLNSAEPLNIKRGDPLFYARFVSKKKINLVRHEIDENTMQIVRTCTNTKLAQRNIKLNMLYELADNLRKRLWFNKKKCPFNWRSK